MACSQNCLYQDCLSYGECLRRKGIQIDRFSLTQNGQPMEKRKDETLSRFRECVKAGITPEKPALTDVQQTERILDSR